MGLFISNSKKLKRNVDVIVKNKQINSHFKVDSVYYRFNIAMLEGQSILPEHLILLVYINKIYYQFFLLQRNLVKLFNTFLKCITSSLILFSKLNFGKLISRRIQTVLHCVLTMPFENIFSFVYSYIVLKTMPSAFLCTDC